MNQKQVKIAEFFRTGNFRQPRLVLLDQTIAKSIDEVVWYHYCYEKEDFENEFERLNGDMYDHVFLDKVRVENWLDENWFSDKPKNRFPTNPILKAQAFTALAFLIGYSLGLGM